MMKAFDTNRTEEKRMGQRNVKEKHNLEENSVEMGRRLLTLRLLMSYIYIYIYIYIRN